MSEPSPADGRWAAIDDLLFQGHRLQALDAIRTTFDLSLQQAIELLGRRFEDLTQSRPEAFKVPLEGYWDGFYT